MINQLRKRRLKTLFDGRREQLKRLEKLKYPLDIEQGNMYSKAVIKYIRARKIWREFRGWT